ncbi:radical SAM family heme chaperone HemW [Candidatus Neomarinimicrobiota bacterium]
MKINRSGGIYLHIPFCKVKCSYCDFYSVPDRDESFDPLVDALVQEIASTEREPDDWIVDTLFIGGGTPSLLTARQLEKIVLALNKRYDLSQLREFTMEANPGEAPFEKLVDFRSIAVNRLSMGFQTFDDSLLQFLGRIHDAKQCYTTFDAARKAGFGNISADMIFNIPGQTADSLTNDLQRLIELEPEHISAYSLTVEQGTPLYNDVQSGEVVMPSEDTDIDMFTRGRSHLETAGYEPYEISNFARDGHTCEHNLHYWRIHPYIGLGPAAHGFTGTERYWSVRSLDGYLERIAAGKSAQVASEWLTEGQLRVEKMIFGLRLTEGVSVTDQLGFKSVEEFTRRFEQQLNKWDDRLNLAGDCLTLTQSGILVADTIAGDFFNALAD